MRTPHYTIDGLTGFEGLQIKLKNFVLLENILTEYNRHWQLYSLKKLLRVKSMHFSTLKKVKSNPGFKR